MEIYKRNILSIINSYGYATQEYPFIDLILKDIEFNKYLIELIEEGEIVELKIKNQSAFISKELYTKYLIIKSNRNLIDSNLESMKNNNDFYSQIISSFSKKYLLFDLGGVIADESDLDVFICNYLDKNVDWDKYKWKDYNEYSEELNRKQDPKWYDYYAQADDLNIDRIIIKDIHIQNLKLVNFFGHSREFLKLLSEKGYVIYFVTGCNSKILELRLSLYSLFDYVAGYITSDISGEIGNKENYFKKFFDKFDINPKDCLFITDNFIKDGLPAIKYDIRTSLFISGGRHNTDFNSHGIKPNDLLTLSLLISNSENKPFTIFDDFKDLIEIVKQLPNIS